MISVYRILKVSILSVILTFSLLINGVYAADAPDPTIDDIIELSKRYPDSAFLLLKKLHHESVLKQDNRTTGICLQQMGEICYAQGHLAQSLDYYHQAHKLFTQLKDKGLLANNFNDVGIVYYQNLDKVTSRKQYDQAMRLYSDIKDRAGLGETYGNIGHLYEKEQRYDSAFYYQQRALKEYSHIDHKRGMAKIYENLGSIFEDLERYDSARYYFDKSLILYKKVNNQVSSIEVINNIGDILRKTGKYKDGLLYSQQALKMSLDTKNEYQEASAYRDIAKAYNLLGIQDSAFYYLELSRKHSLNIYSDQNNRQMSFLKIIYDTDKKNDEIARLENGRKINFIIGTAVVVVIALLIVMGLLTISRQRLKLRESKAIAEKNEQLNLAQQAQLELKSKELTTHTLQVIQHNQFLESIRDKMEEMIKEEKRDQKRQLQQLVKQIGQNINQDQQWKDFTTMFEGLHQSFFDNLKNHCADLTVNDMRLIALLKMNMSSKDMAVIFGISQDSLRVARYRLRKKLNIDQGDNLSAFIQTI